MMNPITHFLFIRFYCNEVMVENDESLQLYDEYYEELYSYTKFHYFGNLEKLETF